MPNYYYISFQYGSISKFFPAKLSIKNITDVKPLKDPHFVFDLREMEFLLTGQWDIWIKMTLKNDKLVLVEKVVNCNVAINEQYPEMYILLTEYFAPKEPDDVLLPQIYELERKYWERYEKQYGPVLISNDPPQNPFRKKSAIVDK